MHNDLPWSGKMANNTEDFANAAVELYTNETDFKHAQQAGNTLLNTVYDKVKLSAALINKIDAISSDLSTHREKNFTGQMLKHHTMRSTQYMAQWIAVIKSSLLVFQVHTVEQHLMLASSLWTT